MILSSFISQSDSIRVNRSRENFDKYACAFFKGNKIVSVKAGKRQRYCCLRLVRLLIGMHYT